jgi:hypothetical protein
MKSKAERNLRIELRYWLMMRRLEKKGVRQTEQKCRDIIERIKNARKK